MRWWWRKRADGFEWRDYVRTTILVRRNERRQKVEDARQAAIFGVKQAAHKGAEAGAAGAGALGRAGKAAGAALGKGGSAAGAVVGRGAASAAQVAGRGAASAARAAGRGAASAAQAAGRGAIAGGAAFARASAAGVGRMRAAARPHLALVGDYVHDRMEPVVDALLRPNLVLPVAIVGLVAAAGGAFRAWNFGIDGESLFAGAIALGAALLYLLPRAAVGDLPRLLPAGLSDRLPAMPAFGRLSSRALSGIAAGVLVVVGAALAWTYWPTGGFTALTAKSPLLTDSGRRDLPSVEVTRLPEVKGRGTALSGDSLKVGGTVVKLAGIEAPEEDQRCAGPGERRWRCAPAAREALARTLRSRSLTCRLAGEDEGGQRLATCVDGDTDIAAELVRSGHVFAVPGFFARYGTAEGEARAAKAGVWLGEAVERPSEFRAKRWAEAKRNAPEGCPIKGRVASGSRTYVLPWSSSYERVRVRQNRGERWFCSEQEARAAGWRPTTL